MSNKKVVKKLLALCGAGIFSLSVLVSPVVSMPVQAAAGSDIVQPLADKIEWRFKIENNKIYKRLYNYSIADWVGD